MTSNNFFLESFDKKKSFCNAVSARKAKIDTDQKNGVH